MRAVVAQRHGGPEVLVIEHLPRPEPASTEVLVEVRAAGVNPVDAKTRGGAGVAAAVGPPPFVPGWDVAGVVVGMGYGVTRFAIGDRVLGMPRFPRVAGCYAEYVTAPSRQLVRIPQGIGFAEAAALPLAALTAWQALVDIARVRPDRRVLITAAAGGVGHLAVQIARARGARVVASAAERHHAILREYGADELVGRDPGEVAGVDVALDLVGGDATLDALAAVRDGGMLVAIADGADERVQAAAAERGVSVSEPLVEPDGHQLQLIAGLVRAGALRVAVAAPLSLEHARQAHERLATGVGGGKLVLEV